MELKTYRHLLLAVVFPWMAVSLAKASKNEKRLTWILELGGHLPAVVYAMFVIVLSERRGQPRPGAVEHPRLAA